MRERRFSKHYYIKLLVALVLFVHIFLTPLHQSYTEEEFLQKYREGDFLESNAELRQRFAEYGNVRSNDYDNLQRKELTNKLINDQIKKVAKQNSYPTVLWWNNLIPDTTDFMQCGQTTCVLTVDRSFLSDDNIAILFYGSSLKWDDLPLPRTPNQVWGLIHDESSKNNIELNFEEILNIFNYTSTFSRHSDVPIETMFLSDLEYLTETLKYPPRKDLESLAPVLYLHSDCQVPTYRDFYTYELMKYISVDSYGSCLNNKKLPDYLKTGDNLLKYQHEDLYKFIHGYKFTLAFENARCDDYTTEKLWRPLHMGSIPIYRGSRTIKDWVPTEHSVIYADDFDSPRALAKYLRYLESNRTAYDEYLTFKKGAPINQRLVNRFRGQESNEQQPEINFIEKFNCYICEKLSELLEARKQNRYIKPKTADITHYNCEIPRKQLPEIPLDDYFDWYGVYKHGYDEAKRIRDMVLNNG